MSNAFIDVSGFTLIQRMTPNSRRIAVLGLIDSVANGGVALGGVVAPVLIEALGHPRRAGRERADPAHRRRPARRRPCAGWTKGGVGGARRVELIRGEPLFAPLSLATVEHLAGGLTPVAFDDGAWLMREGEPGVDYVLIDTGSVEVSQEGQRRPDHGAGWRRRARSRSCATCRGRRRSARSGR